MRSDIIDTVSLPNGYRYAFTAGAGVLGRLADLVHLEHECCRFLACKIIVEPVSTRRVQVSGIASGASGLWMSQIARNLTDAVDGFFTGKRYLIHDRDPLYTKEFLNYRDAAWQFESGWFLMCESSFWIVRGTEKCFAN
jgi:hypothetical protein